MPPSKERRARSQKGYQRTAKADPRWKLIEKTVQALEKILDPGAEIRHNEQLPELDTGILRQCDITIRSGKPPRQTLTIVEVQDRSRKVTLPIYDAWYRKREKLGAQHLICVSTTGFPNSVIKCAKKTGETVRLVTLTEGAPPPFFQAREHYLRMKVLHSRDVAIGWVNEAPPSAVEGHRCDSKVFSVNYSSQTQSMIDIVQREFLAGKALDLETETPRPNMRVNRYRLDLTAGESAVWLETASGPEQVRDLFVEDYIEVVNISMPLTFHAYEQIGHEETLAWVVFASGTYEENIFSVRIMLARQSNGHFTIMKSELSPIPGLTIMSDCLLIATTVSAEERQQRTKQADSGGSASHNMSR